MKDPKTNLQEQMLKFRAKNRLSQRESANRSGVSLQTWYSIEKGYQTPSKITETKIRLLIEDEED